MVGPLGREEPGELKVPGSSLNMGLQKSTTQSSMRLGEREGRKRTCRKGEEKRRKRKRKLKRERE